MTDMREKLVRIVAKHPDVTVSDAEYVADEIIAALPDMVQPLVWWEPTQGNNYTHGAKTIFGTYYASICGGRHWASVELFHESGDIEQWDGENRGSLIEAQMDAQRHYDHRILSTLEGVTP